MGQNSPEATRKLSGIVPRRLSQPNHQIIEVVALANSIRCDSPIHEEIIEPTSHCPSRPTRNLTKDLLRHDFQRLQENVINKPSRYKVQGVPDCLTKELRTRIHETIRDLEDFERLRHPSSLSDEFDDSFVRGGLDLSTAITPIPRVAIRVRWLVRSVQSPLPHLTSQLHDPTIDLRGQLHVVDRTRQLESVTQLSQHSQLS